jgi:hypothetical protein
MGPRGLSLLLEALSNGSVWAAGAKDPTHYFHSSFFFFFWHFPHFYFILIFD